MFLVSAMTMLVLALTTSTTADFLISNTTVCQGFPMSCPHGAQIVTSTTQYTCNELVPAQDNAYLHNGTIGPFGDWQLWMEGICGSGQLEFMRRWEDDGYDVRDEDGENLGTCTEISDQLTQACDYWIIGILFRSVYRCESSVCA